MKKLPDNVQSLISASNQLNNHNKVIEELVYNSLDAGATSVAIRVNIDANVIQVIDNGCGVSKKDLKFIGDYFMTSKFIDLSSLKAVPSKYGFRGQFLANLIHISKCVIVASRHANSDETWMKLIENAKEKQLKMLNSTRPSKGTTVEVQGFLYNLNIKKNAKDSWNDLHSIRTFLEHLSIVHSNISFSLRDDLKNEIVFKMHKNRDIYQTLSTLYNIGKEDVQELKVEKKEYKVKGLLGKSDMECNRNDIFLNGKFISVPSKLHKIVNNYIKKYSNVKERKILKIKNNNYEEDSSVLQNKIPFYFIFMNCPYMDYNISNSPKQSVLEFKDWDQVNKLLEKLIKFSAGNCNLKEIAKKDKEITHCNVSETREQVKKIMEKILGTHPKKSGISHVHKGVKGKKIKRKERCLPLEKLASNSINHNDINLSSHSIQDTEDQNKICKVTTKLQRQNKKHVITQKIKPKKSVKESKTKPCITNNFGKMYGGKLLSNHNKTLAKEQKTMSKKFNNKVYRSKEYRLLGDDLMKKFETDTNTLKQRCRALEHHVKSFLNLRNNGSKNMLVSETVELCNLTINNKNMSIRKKIDEMVIHRYLPKPKANNATINHHYHVEKQNYPSNYDLLETVIKSQEDNKIMQSIAVNKLQSMDPIKSPPHVDIGYKQYGSIDLDLSKNTVDPVVTFQSHHYYGCRNFTSQNTNIQIMEVAKNDCENFNKKSRNVFDFMTKQSKDNFNIPFSRKFNRVVKRNLTNGHFKQFDAKIKRLFTETSKLLSLKQQFMGKTSQSSYTIEFTKSEDNKLMTAEEKGLLSETYSVKHPIINVNIEESGSNSACITINNNQANDINRDHNIDINSTYFLSDTARKYVRKDEIDGWLQFGTYTIDEDSIERHTSNQSIITFNKEVHDKNYIFVSKSQDHTTNEHILDPITVCETILNSPEVTNLELDSSSYNKDPKKFIRNLNYHCYNSYQVTEGTNKKENQELTETILNFDQNVPNGNALEISHHFSLPNNGFSISKISTIKTTRNENDNIVLGDENQTQNIFFGENTIKEVENITNGDDVFNLKNRLCFVPKGMSPIFENCRTKITCQYNLSGDCYEDGMYNNFIDNVRNNAEVFKPKIQEALEVATGAIEKVNVKINKDNSSLKFDGKCLRYAKVLGQVDEKFIAAIIRAGCNNEELSDFLVLFDQHAVHERIRLENNLSEYLVDNQWISISIDEVILKISKDDALFLHNYRDKFEQLGLQWTVLSSNEISFHAIPAAILGKNLREVDKVIKAVRSLITEEINIIKMQGGCVSLYPKSIMELVFSEACRYAIKFGEKLSKCRCVELLEMLSECKTPFQCAHGRPVMAVIMEITQNTCDYKVNINKITEWKTNTLPKF